MFKHFLIGILCLLIIFAIIKVILIKFHKIYFHKGIIKYKFNEYDLQHLKNHSIKRNIQDLKSMDSYIFYQEQKWNSKNNNYIHDTINDRYYIIDYGYYYYIPDSRYSLIVNKNNEIYHFDFLKYKNKVVFL
jgi:hypothetical protein